MKHNLSKKQKIGIVVIIQAVIVVVVAALVSYALKPSYNVTIVNEGGTNIPDENWRGIKNELWYLIQNHVMGATESDINDAVIRDGSYEENTENNVTTATFLLDIDSLRQTYVITTSWSDEVKLYDYMTINCPKKEEMKYPETVCYGMYNNSYSLSLYLPYIVNSPYENATSDIFIEGDEYNKLIEVMLTTCNTEENKKKAMDYLDNIPIDLSGYTIKYHVSGEGAKCSDN